MITKFPFNSTWIKGLFLQSDRKLAHCGDGAVSSYFGSPSIS